MLPVGTRLGPYEVDHLIGAGGMGEVYRGRDTRLHRAVAVKVLPPSLTRDGQRREQFEREARAIASLSHPYICAIYDVGRSDDVEFLVMELVDGDTLADRLAARTIRIDDAIRYAAQIADALDAAHRRGIVHRDLKPSNVMITPDGVKLLDFGLAQWQARLPSTDVVTETEPGDEEQPTRGTLAYMAPEQMHGKKTDARTDIFALGLIVYEMVTGRRPFDGNTRAGIIAATLEREPVAIGALVSDVPSGLERCVSRCLAKDPEQRWQSARDLAAELRWIAQYPVARTPAPEKRLWTTRAVGRYIVTAAAAAAVMYGAMRLTMRPLPRAAAVVFDVHLPPTIALKSAGVLSPNGEYLGFVGSDGATARIWLRPLGAPDRLARFLAGTEGAHTLFWSPDSTEIAFFVGNRLKALNVVSGAVRPITTADSVVRASGTWGRSGVIVFATSDAAGGGPLYAVSAAGGSIREVTTIDVAAGDDGHRFPYFLPDGHHFLYTAKGTRDRDGLYVGSLSGDAPVRVLNLVTRAAFVAPGWLLYNRGSVLVVQQFNPDTFSVRGDVRPLGEHLGVFGAGQNVAFSVAATGMLATVMSETEPSRLEWRSRAGDVLEIVRGGHELRNPAISPDGKRIAAVRGLTQTLWWSDGTAGSFVRFGPDDTNYFQPLWSPEGSRIAYGAVGASGSRIAVVSIDRPFDEQVLVPEDRTVTFPHDWSAEGWITLARRDPATGFDIWLVSTATREMRPFLATSAHEFLGRVAPNGKWMTFASNVTGRYEIYAERFPNGGERVAVSRDGGLEPQWRDDGRELFYLSADNWLMAVPVEGDDPIRFGSPTRLFRFATVGIGRNHYSPAPGGQMFLIDAALPYDGHPTITIITDWLPQDRQP